MNFSSLWKSVTVLGIAAMAISFTACGDDAAGPDPNAGIKSPVTFFNVNPGLPVPVNFAIGSDNIATSVPYGTPQVVQVQIGQQTVAVKSTAGSTLASVGLQIDSTRPVWVIHSGDVSPADAFAVDAPKDNAMIASALANNKAIVRVINASNNAGKVSLRTGDAFGPVVAGDIEYKKGSSFTTVDTSTTTFVFTKSPTAGDTVAVPAVKTAPMTPGKIYTIVLYGSSNASAAAEQKLMTKIVAEP